MVLPGNGFQTQQSPHGGLDLVRAIFVGLFDLLQPNIRAGIDFRGVIIALIGGEEVVERLWTGCLSSIGCLSVFGIVIYPPSGYLRRTRSYLAHSTPSPFTHCEEGGRIHFRENLYSFPPPTATPAMMNLLRKR